MNLGVVAVRLGHSKEISVGLIANALMQYTNHRCVCKLWLQNFCLQYCGKIAIIPHNFFGSSPYFFSLPVYENHYLPSPEEEPYAGDFIRNAMKAFSLL
jgi:hypothetical protein